MNVLPNRVFVRMGEPVPTQMEAIHAIVVLDTRETTVKSQIVVWSTVKMVANVISYKLNGNATVLSTMKVRSLDL
jgi:hypothetical protein